MQLSHRIAALAAVVAVPLGIAATSYALSDRPDAPREAPARVELVGTPSPDPTPSDVLVPGPEVSDRPPGGDASDDDHDDDGADDADDTSGDDTSDDDAAADDAGDDGDDGPGDDDADD
ncbi:small secreted hydrophilic protein [Streptomyces sp. UH6]|uniref:small secreted hydrophilic protein n=1 Tax=Streptomyces sp. UH6 TaxID=2748379 RepID=UPI0015D4C5F2|nr:small secreted hydrophilic protein [Streptomyces sp. UH6]NYV76629.1 small secreted hydrophilic protein [Streptomyces sp. UH6]